MKAESDGNGTKETMRSDTKNAVFIHKNYCILTCLIFISISMTATGTRQLTAFHPYVCDCPPISFHFFSSRQRHSCSSGCYDGQANLMLVHSARFAIYHVEKRSLPFICANIRSFHKMIRLSSAMQYVYLISSKNVRGSNCSRCGASSVRRANILSMIFTMCRMSFHFIFYSHIKKICASTIIHSSFA